MPGKYIKYNGATYRLVTSASYDVKTTPMYYYVFTLDTGEKRDTTIVGVVAHTPELAEQKANEAFRSFGHLFYDDVVAGKVMNSTKGIPITYKQLLDITLDIEPGDYQGSLLDHVANQFAQQGWAYTEIP